MADIRSLALLRNDPEEAGRLLLEAEQGDVDAQYAMGLIYAEGRGIPQDEARSFFWLTRAAEQGDEEALILRRVVAANISDDQFAEAQRLLKEKPVLNTPADSRRPRRKRRRAH